MNGKPKNAWDVYVSTETSTDSYALLLLIANDNYKMGHFYYAVKGFEALEKIDTENEYEEPLRGAVLGVFQMVIAGKESVEHLIEAAAILKSCESSAQVIIWSIQNERVIKAIKKWGKENNLDFDEIGLWLCDCQWAYNYNHALLCVHGWKYIIHIIMQYSST